MYDMTNDELLDAVSRITPQWLAGFFDGEGAVSTFEGGLRPYNVRVQLNQSDAKLLSLVAMKFKGCQGPFELRSNKSIPGYTCRPCFRIQWGGRACVPFLEYIESYVVCKRRQVEAGLKIARYVAAREEVGDVSTRLCGSDELEDRARLACIIKEANGKIFSLKDFQKERIDALASKLIKAHGAKAILEILEARFAKSEP